MAATVALLFAWLERRSGMLAASLGSLSLLLMPHAFAHGHIDGTDTPVSCFWLLSLLFWPGIGQRARSDVLASVVVGLGLATKATFFLLPLVLLAWTVIWRRDAFARGVLVLAGAVLVMFSLCPMWWAAPLTSPVSSFARAFERSEAIWHIDAYYLGKTYAGNLPWHNGIVLSLVSTPPLTLVLAALSVPLWRRNAEATLLAAGAFVLPLLRMLPGVPGHDGVRLLLPSLYCLAPLAGLGFASLAPALAPKVRGAIAASTLLASAGSVISMHPFQLSYYSEAIGGLRGAERLGFEVSYWFDALTPRALGEIQALLPRGATVRTYPTYAGLKALQKWGLWREDLGKGREDADYLILYSRKGSFAASPEVLDLYEHGRPLWAERCQGVQLVGLYRIAD